MRIYRHRYHLMPLVAYFCNSNCFCRRVGYWPTAKQDVSRRTNELFLLSPSCLIVGLFMGHFTIEFTSSRMRSSLLLSGRQVWTSQMSVRISYFSVYPKKTLQRNYLTKQNRIMFAQLSTWSGHCTETATQRCRIFRPLLTAESSLNFKSRLNNNSQLGQHNGLTIIDNV